MTRTTRGKSIPQDIDRRQEREAPPSSLLITQPLLTEVGRDACIDAMTVQPPSTANLVVITHEASPDKWLAAWRERIGEPPANLALITVGSTRSSTARPTPILPEAAAGESQVFSIADPGDLTQLGTVVSERLTDWRDTDHRPVVCGGSLTALLQWVDLPILCRFLHVFLQRLRAADAVSNFHLDPAAHTDQTRQTLEPLFDRVIDEPLNRADRASPASLDTDAILEVVGAARRRHVLRSLLDEGPLPMHDLTTQVVAREHTEAPNALSDRTRERTRIDLHHNHLAKIETAGLIEYDKEQDTVHLVANTDQIELYLAVSDDSG